MRRFKFNSDFVEPIIIEAESEELAWPLFLKECEKSFDEASALEKEISVQEIGQTEHQFGPRPTCCNKINTTPEWRYYTGPPVQLQVHEHHFNTDKLITRPHWKLNELNIEIFYCPFCGTKLPEVELKQLVPTPIWTPNEGYGYCGTCQERNGLGCECNPPSAAYQIKIRVSSNL